SLDAPDAAPNATAFLRRSLARDPNVTALRQKTSIVLRPRATARTRRLGRDTERSLNGSEADSERMLSGR
ncbi:hypothetical protein DVK00_20945, partial [Haloarcula sp. Atlit-47R]|uniref:hypothetical protein n=1 Tax=Haloarcula sp. Atlit-47R TaxID=2282132 RepID=UPI000FF4C370